MFVIVDHLYQPKEIIANMDDRYKIDKLYIWA